MRTTRRGRVVIGLAMLVAGCATAAPPPPSDLVWPMPPDTPRVQYLETLATSDHFGGKSSWIEDVVLGADAAKARRMLKPQSVAVDAKGRVYVADSGVGRVWVFDGEKKQVRFLGETAPSLVGPVGVAVDGRGIVFVSDTRLGKVFGYDEAGRVVLSIGAENELLSPTGLAIDTARNRLFVADTRKHRVRAYDTVRGTFLFEIAERGPEPGQLNFPTYLTVKRGLLYVSDTGNFRVQAFDLDGKYRRKWGELGANFGQLARPKGIALDSDGHLYVVDAAFGNFQIFDREGDLMLFVGGNGADRGQFRLPSGLFIDDRDRIYVVDQYNARVQVFQYLGTDVEFAKANRPGKTTR